MSVPAIFDWEPDLEAFESTAWPRLARRLPAFEAVRLRNAWACHYAYNIFDGNMIIGAWPGAPENFLIATGFSGHGLQHRAGGGPGALGTDPRRRLCDHRPRPLPLPARLRKQARARTRRHRLKRPLPGLFRKRGRSLPRVVGRGSDQRPMV